MAKNNENIEKIIKLIGPRSDMELLPQISVEKYLATDEPKNAPKDPPALIIPKNFFESVWLKKLIMVTQKTETTKKLNTLYQM